jgi:hypothetical protein
MILKIKSYNFIKNNYLIILLFLIGIKTIFYEKNFISYDELYNLINYTNIYTLFLKDTLNNHIINSFFGIIIGNFTYEINYLRFSSFIFFIFGIFLISLKLKCRITLLVIFLFFLIGNNFFIYSFLYRGYAYQFFLFSLALFLLDKKFESEKKYIFILLIFSVLTALAPSNLFLIIPLIIIFRENFKIKKIFFFYIISTVIFLIPNIILNGIYSLRTKIDLININTLYFFNLENFYILFLEGVQSYAHVTFQFYEKITIIDLIQIFLRDDKIIICVYIIFTISTLVNLFLKKKTGLDNVFLLHLLFIFLVSSSYSSRIYYPFYPFYLILIDRILFRYFNILKIIHKYTNILLTLLFFLCLMINLEKKLLLNYDIKYHYEKLKEYSIKYDNILKIKCGLDRKLTNSQLEIDIYYYKYLTICNKKINIFEIKKFQKITFP